MEYRNIEIQLSEVKEFDYKGAKFTSKDGGLVYIAESVAGLSAANTPQKAIEDSHKLIDTYLSML